MSIRTVNAISGRLSLRSPQRDSLEILDRITEVVDLGKRADPKAALDLIRSEYPGVTDFEREFPSLCFALATGVGKTRLMGAFIAYLHLERGLNDFFVLAPNLTIYEKLKQDFTPNSAKYVFRGLGEFSTEGIELITGDDYEDGRGVRKDTLEGFRRGIHINVFNIAKINSEVRGGRAPRIKKLREYVGQSYFEYLSSLQDLVLIMDESHRYRGGAGVKVLNELRPVLGLELTATPQTQEGTRTVAFKNVILDYKLARAMADGFVKEPAIATKQNFRVEDYKDDPDGLELVKLKDGVCLHEDTKAELKVYAEQHDRPFVKPFMLVVTRDIAHARRVVEIIKQDDFFNGDYRDKVITVHSAQSGEEKEETVAALLSVESPANQTEIVVHVDKLKEGWDVTNLYTIVPLRKADSRTLVEQSIGRGLRLPYGQRTGVKAVDRLTIIAHDNFQEIIDEASKPGSSINFKLQTVVIGEDVAAERKVARTVATSLEVEIAGTDPTRPGVARSANGRPVPFATPAEQGVARATIDAIRTFERDPGRVPNIEFLTQPAIQAELIKKVAAAVAPKQMEFAGVVDAPDIPAIVARATALLIERTIGIPRIYLLPKGEVTTGFDDFDLDSTGVNLQPVDQSILLHEIRTGDRELLQDRGLPQIEERLEDELVKRLIDYDDIDYDEQSDLLYKLAGQMTGHLRSYLPDEDAVANVLLHNRQKLVDLIYAQMGKHRWQHAAGYEATARCGFEVVKSVTYSAPESESVRDFRQAPTPLHEIPRMLFGGFSRCLYPVQKFSSDPERRFAVLLENEPEDLKWYKPARDQFRIEYRAGQSYEPDFVVETATHKYLIEPKRANEVDDPEVRAKARAAVEWCRHATAHGLEHGDKPWSYLLIPHDAIKASATLQGLAATYTRRPEPEAAPRPLTMATA